MPLLATYFPFTPPASTPDTVPPVAFTPPGSSPSSTAPTTFTPPGSGVSSTPPSSFSAGSFAPSVVPPALFFPVITFTKSTFDLAQQPTLTIAPAASEVVFVVSGFTWTLWTLTAGTTSADSTHVLPLDYDATLNAKFWLLTNSGTIGPGNVLIDNLGNVLVDDAGNSISYG